MPRRVVPHIFRKHKIDKRLLACPDIVPLLRLLLTGTTLCISIRTKVPQNPLPIAPRMVVLRVAFRPDQDLLYKAHLPAPRPRQRHDQAAVVPYLVRLEEPRGEVIEEREFLGDQGVTGENGFFGR